MRSKQYFLDTETTITPFYETMELLLLQISDGKTIYLIRGDLDLNPLKFIENRRIIGHNIKFDYKILLKKNIRLDRVYDTMIAEYLLNANKSTPKGFYSLEQCVLRYTGENPYGEQLNLFREYIPKNLRTTFAFPLTKAQEDYAAEDIYSVIKVFRKQLPLLKKFNLMRIAVLENDFVLVLGDMEVNGVKLDVGEWLKIADKVEMKCGELLAQLKESAPEVENWRSHVQVKKFFRGLGINTTASIKGESKETVSITHMGKYSKDYPIVDIYIQYKELEKLRSSYGKKFLKYVNPHTGNVHSDFMQILVTGRTSSNSPNMQNIVAGKGIDFRAPFKPDGVFVDADYSNQELRILAQKSREPAMLQIFNDGLDFHSSVATRVLGELTTANRKKAKTLTFAIIYGAGINKIKEFLKISAKEAKELIDSYFQSFPHLKKYLDTVYNNAIINNYIEIDIFGRKSFIDFDTKEYQRFLDTFEPTNSKEKEIYYEVKKSLAEVLRTACNHPIQGSAATMAKLAGILLRRHSKQYGFKIRLLVHDQWVIDCDTQKTNEITRIMEKCMSQASRRICPDIPAVIDMKITNQWSK
jgi:DNA polymerase-1